MTVHRIGRRSFLADLGRGTLAVAVFSPVVAACGDDDPSAGPTSTDETTTTTGSRTSSSGPLQWERVSLGFVSAYVLVRGRSAAIVDTGTPGSAGDIERALDSAGLGWDAVAHVILTHAHGDHIGSVAEVLGAAPAATTYAGAADIPSIDAAGPDIVPAADGDEIFGLRIVATPGHTEGHISAYDAETRLLVAGDAINGTDGTGVTGANADFTADLAMAAASARRLAALDVDTILFGHGEPVATGANPLLDALVDG